MKTLRIAALLAPIALGACVAPPYVSRVEVTRFTGDEPQLLGTGPIAVIAPPGLDQDSLEASVFQNAVANELHQLGYIVTGDMAQQVAEVSVEQFVETAGHRNGSSVGVGVGGSSGGWYGSGGGVGVGVGLDLTPRPADRYTRELRVMIKPAAGGLALWEGRARFTASANSNMAQTDAAAAKLADALFAGFPGQSGETIEVE